MNIAEQFKKLRSEKGFSVYKLYKLSDVSENYIHKIEKGESLPSVFVLEKLLNSLDTTLSEFFCEDNSAIYPTDFEREILTNLRRLTQEESDTILHLIKLMAK